MMNYIFFIALLKRFRTETFRNDGAFVILRSLCSGSLSVKGKALFWKKAAWLVRMVTALVVLTQSVSPNSVWAAFDDMGAGARAPGMADAFVGVADDANTIMYNPAGLAQLGQSEISTQFSQLNRGLDDGSEIGTQYLGYAHPIKNGEKGGLGMAYHNFKISGLYNERTLVLGYGRKLDIQPFGWAGTWLAGGSIKQLHREFLPNEYTRNAIGNAGTGTDEEDPLFAKHGYSTEDFAIDLGGLYRFGYWNRYSLGLALTNVNRPDVSLGGDNDNPPFTTKLGVGYRPVWGVVSAELRRSKRLAGKSDTEAAFGLERRFNLKDYGTFEIRGGYAEGSREYKKFTMGLSYLIGQIQLDYAFDIPIANLSDTSGSHRVGFSYRWGGPSEIPPSKDMRRRKTDLLEAFKHNSSSSLFIINRAAEDYSITRSQETLLLEYLLHVFPPDATAMDEARQELLLRSNRTLGETQFDWLTVKSLLLAYQQSMTMEVLDPILEDIKEGRLESSLDKMKLLESNTQRSWLAASMKLLALGMQAAEAYRSKQIDVCIGKIEELLKILPDDEALKRALWELNLHKSKSIAPKIAIEFALPEAPAPLVAPKPVIVKPEEDKKISDFDLLLQQYNIDLGQYFERKQKGASIDERKAMLQEMVAHYSNKGLDLSIVKKELAAMEKAPKVNIKPKAKAPTPKTSAPKKEAASIETPGNAALRESLDYYQQAVKRGISDQERIEILESILIQFGEDSAPNINKELERIRKRTQDEP